MRTALRVTAALSAFILLLIGIATVVINVLHGTKVKGAAHPWHVAVMVSQAYKCGGEHIGGGWVLTAKHCVDHAVEISLVANRDSLAGNPQTMGNCEPLETPQRKLSCVRLAPRWDLALVQLGPTVANRVKSIGRPKPGDLPLGTVTHVVGWGLTAIQKKIGFGLNHLRAVNLKIVPNTSCAAAQLGVPKPSLCAAGSFDGLCGGDSGGALVKGTLDGGGAVIEGIASKAETCDQGSIFQRVRYATFVDISDADVLHWIEDQMTRDGT